MIFWYWLAAIFLAVIFGGVLTLVLYGGLNAFKDMLFIKRGIPKNREKVSEYIKEHPEKFNKTNPGVPLEEDKKEVQEDERRRNEKYREFDKLRQLEIKQRDGRATKTEQRSESTELYTPGIPELPRQNVLSDGGNSRDENSSGGNPQLKRRVKLDE